MKLHARILRPLHKCKYAYNENNPNNSVLLLASFFLPSFISASGFLRGKELPHVYINQIRIENDYQLNTHGISSKNAQVS
jgi:hypothetical protein